MHALDLHYMFMTLTLVCLYYSGEGSQYSGNSDERNIQAMTRAVSVHPDTLKVMYFAWGQNANVLIQGTKPLPDPMLTSRQ